MATIQKRKEIIAGSLPLQKNLQNENLFKQ